VKYEVSVKRSIYFFLYFSEGAPIGFIWWALPALLEKAGFSITEIATLSAVATLPWTLKFILAPMVDILSIKLLK
jgi:MFS transporter, PAT family, beta-lactamase induction signal transducer AmpG